jgi:cytoskeletal protein RodZ
MSELKRRLFKVVGDGGQSERQKRVEPIEEVREGIAQLLKQTRERYGQSLRDVSASLRIRLAYLQAIESGRFRELPGTTYAVGFVRSYAEYLGLDANEIVRRFKGEVEGLDNRTHLAFPEPVPEGKVPGGAIIIVSLVVLAIGYGGWYAINRDADGVGLIPRVSESLKGLVSKGEQKSETAAAPSTTTSAQTAPGDTGKSTPPASSIPTPTTAPLAGAPAATSPVPSAPSPASGQEINSPAGLTGAPASAPAVGAPGIAASPANSGPEDVIVGSTEEDDTTGSSVAAPSSGDGTSLPAAPSVPDALSATAPAAPQLASPATGGESRLQLRARLASWVQIRDASGVPILTRTLAAGERVPVPDQPGLTLFTGNAGGVEILLDGRALPALGPVGAVRRNIPLDLKALQQGRAAE